MRIVLTSVYGWPEVRRGAERYVHELGAALHRAGHQVRIVISAEASGDDQVLGVPVQRIRRYGRWVTRRYGEGPVADSVEFGLATINRLALSRMDVWHAMSTGDGLAAGSVSRLRPGLRSVYTEMGFPARTSRSMRADHEHYVKLLRRVDEVVCLSDAATQLLQTDYGRTGHTIPAGVDTSVFAPEPAVRHHRPVMLVPSAMSERRKNLDAVLAAAGRLHRAGVDLETWLVGPGPLPRLSEAGRRGLPTVTVQREATSAELPGLYRRAWLTVLPAGAEVFGLVALESLACGVPVVVLDDGLGPAQLVTPGTGIRVNSDLSDLDDGIRAGLDLTALPETRDACAARGAEYSWDTAVVPRMLELYAR